MNLVCTSLFFCSLYCIVLWLCKLKTSLSGDIETNPGPTHKKQNKSFSICYWNFDSITEFITAHGYAKVSLLKAYITAHKIDIICLSETYLDCGIWSRLLTLGIDQSGLINTSVYCKQFLLISSPMNTKFQLIFLTKYYNRRQNAVNIHFDVSSKSAFHLLKSST